MSTWLLEDVTEAARAYPDTFFIPNEDRRRSVAVGHRAKLHFLLMHPPLTSRVPSGCGLKSRTAESVANR